MRRYVLQFIIMLSCSVASWSAMAAGPAKIEFVQSVYEDSQDIGLNHPEGVGCKDGVFVVGDTGNDRLVKYTYQDRVAKSTELVMQVTAPLIVQINSKDEIYALDGRDRRIVILNPDGSAKGYLSPKGSPVARKMVPKSFRIDENDNIYVLDISEGLVLVLDPAGNYQRHVTFPKPYGFISDIAVGPQGMIYAVDSTNPGVYSAAKDDKEFSLLTSGLREYSNFPTNLAVYGGIIYVVDKHGGNLVLLSPDGSFLGHRFGYGWKEAQFYYPAQLCISGNGNFFVADRNNSRVQIFKAGE